MSSGLINAAFSAEKLREKPLPNTIFLVSQFSMQRFLVFLACKFQFSELRGYK